MSPMLVTATGDAMADSVHIHGHADARFSAVADAFRENFRRGRELGAAVAVVHEGRLVVDLWGGTRDRRTGAPFERDTLVPLFSTGKGLVAMAALIAVSRGRFRLDAPVAEVWPAFGAVGKEAVTVRHILEHTSGLVLFGRAMRRERLSDRSLLCRDLEAMVPLWRPGSAYGYQIGSFGELVAEIMRRADLSDRTFSQAFAADVAAPLGLDVHFGRGDLESVDIDHRTARIAGPLPRHVMADFARLPPGFRRKLLDPMSLLHRALRQLPDFRPNDPVWMRLPFPSANGIGTARAVATAYAEMAVGGGRLDIAPDVFADLTADPVVPPEGGRDRVMGVEVRYRLGFVRPGPGFGFASPKAFGMPGLGGSFGFGDPEKRLGYAYAPNRMGVVPFDEPREKVLRMAVLKAAG